MTEGSLEDARTRGEIEEIARELFRRRADLTPHARGSLDRHLEGTRAILARWGQPDRVCKAGLLHSAYSTEAYGHRLFGRDERARVRELAGEEAERLVFTFCACRRSALIEAAEIHPGGGPSTLTSRWTGITLRLEPRELADLLILHAANLAEQASLPRGSPSRWLALAHRLIAAAVAKGAVSPPVLSGDAGEMTREAETALLGAYRSLVRGDPASPEALMSAPVGEPLVFVGLQALADRRGEEAAAYGARARRAFDAWGVAWDKRLRVERWRELAERLVREGASRDRPLDVAARRAREALLGARGSPARLWATLDGAAPLASGSTRSAPPVSPGNDDTKPGLPPRFARYIAGLRANAERPMLQFYPGLRARPWHDPRDFPIVEELERLAPAIAREAAAFDPASFQDEAEDIGRRGRWGVLFLLEMGRRNEETLAACPTLRGVLERHRTLTTHAGLMYFSCLDPKTRVAPHRGPTNVRLRCHLGLDVPDGCGVRVGGVTGAWREGRCIVFDDSFEHEVWNDGDGRRIVLVLDLWHPDLGDDEVGLLAGLHRYGAANESGARRYHARNDAARERARGASREPPESLQALDRGITAALRQGDLPLAGDRALHYAQRCRGTRWYPVRRDDDPGLPSDVAWAPILTPAKLVHDVEQLQYLRRRGVVDDDVTAIIPHYEALLDTLRPLGDGARVPLAGAAQKAIGHAYNRLVHVRATPRVGRALSPRWSAADAEATYLAKRPNVLVIDDLLSTEAIQSLRLFCLESTIWSTNRYDHGRLGSFFRDGFNCPLLLQIAEELRAAFPNVIGARHPVTQVWGYKYATTQPALPPHADFAAVNVNFWITPDEANLEPGGGGLVLYDVEAPKDWDFPTYNRNGEKIRALLAERNAKATHIPYRYNRAVIFDSDLFHATPALRFLPGYENRRINVTVLFGDRLRA